MISCLGDNEGCMHRLGGQQHTSKWKRINPQVRMREQEPIQLAKHDRNRQFLTYPVQCFLPLTRTFVLWKGAPCLWQGQARLSPVPESMASPPWTQSLSRVSLPWARPPAARCSSRAAAPCSAWRPPRPARPSAPAGTPWQSAAGSGTRSCRRLSLAGHCLPQREKGEDPGSCCSRWSEAASGDRDVRLQLLIPSLYFMSFAKKLFL